MTPRGSTLGPGPEFDLIRAIQARLGDRASGLGDDCAWLPTDEGWLAVSVDTSVDGVHFRGDWMSPAEIGWRAAAGALSDLAAAGAECLGALAALTVPPQERYDVVEVMDGVGACVASVGGVVLGGDLTGGDVWSISVTVLGRAHRRIGRSGARARDGVWVTGTLGGARAALVAWESGAVPDVHAREAFVHPQPRLRVGRWLVDHGATALLDLSDGLGGDAGHLAAASGVGLDIALERLPVHASARAVGPRFAAQGGEDYELLVTLPEGFAEAEAAACLTETGVPLTRIGTASEESGVRFRLRGVPETLTGYNHFRD